MVNLASTATQAMGVAAQVTGYLACGDPNPLNCLAKPVSNSIYFLSSYLPRIPVQMADGFAAIPDSVFNAAASFAGSSKRSDNFVYSTLAYITSPLKGLIEKIDKEATKTLFLDTAEKFTANMANPDVNPKPSEALRALHLIGPAAVYLGCSWKFQENASNVLRSITKLAKGYLTGNWISETNLTTLPGCQENCVGVAKVFKAHTPKKLFQSMIIDSGYTCLWGSLMYLTREGIRNAIEEGSQRSKEEIGDCITILQVLPIAWPILNSLGVMLKQNICRVLGNCRTKAEATSRFSVNKREYRYESPSRDKEYPIEKLLKEIEKIEQGGNLLDPQKNDSLQDISDGT